MSSFDELVIYERGRKALGDSCYAYFEVISTPPNVTELDIYALNDIGHVLGRSHVYRINEILPEMLFEVFFSSVTADQVSCWQFQGGTGRSAKYIYHAVALTSDALAYQSDPVHYVAPPAPVLEAVHALPSLKNGWTGPVIGSLRSKYFHHPECRRARALDPHYRREYPEPQLAWKNGLRPCYDCLWTLQ